MTKDSKINSRILIHAEFSINARFLVAFCVYQSQNRSDGNPGSQTKQNRDRNVRQILHDVLPFYSPSDFKFVLIVVYTKGLGLAH